ncbi:MAG: hypothetical protein LBT30_03955 [Clostridiales bacterium]|jgi:hypothetical protein|nr:hypothetical protein [Clostridiales bacterium]
MTFKSDLSAAEFTETYGSEARERMFYNIKLGASYVRIKKRGDRTFAMRGKILEKQPLKLNFIDSFAVRFAVLYTALIVCELVFANMDIAAAVLLSVSVYTALYVAGKVRSAETARALISDFKLKLVLDKDKYNIAYNYFYYYLIIIFFAIYPCYILLKDGLKLEAAPSIVISAAAAAAFVVWLVLTRNITELFFIDREGIIRQNIFIAKDKLVYSAADIESITVVNKDLRGADKETAFVFELKIKESALYRPEGKFPHIKEKDTIYLPFNKVTAEIIKEKLCFDVETFNYDEFYK